MKLKAPVRNVLVRMQLDNKEKYKFANGMEIQIMKGFDFNKRIDSPSIGEVVDGIIPTGAMCLLHHNSSHDSFKVFGYKNEAGKLIENLYSVAEDMVFCYKENGKEWQPMKDFLITLRIFKPYEGVLTGIEPKQIIQRLYCLSGKVSDYKVEGKAIIVTKHSDYEIIFHQDGKPSSIIRTRLRECLGIDYDLTNEIKNGKLLIGNNLEDAKILNEIECQTILQ